MEAIRPRGLVDDRLAIIRAPDQDRVLIPLTRRPDGQLPVPGAQLQEAEVPLNPKLPPADRVRMALEDQLPDRVLERLPTGWQMLGEVCVVRLDEALAGYQALVGQALGQALGARSVLHLEGSRGELREPDTRLVWGDPDTRTVHREHGLIFHLDPAKVMFSAGNKHERHRLVDRIEPGEHVVDLFAGVGYFTLPLARAGARVTACEKNPVSAGFLADNVQANALADRVEIRRGDCRQVAPVGTADRVLLGYFPGTHRFLATAVGALGAAGGCLHYHTVAEGPEPLAAAEAELLDHLPDPAPAVTSIQARRVKTVAPGTSHVVLDVEVDR